MKGDPSLNIAYAIASALVAILLVTRVAAESPDNGGDVANVEMCNGKDGVSLDTLILACSALKESYRTVLRDEVTPPDFVYLDVDPQTIRDRLQHRTAHFFPKELMDSQFAALEKPKDAIIIDARKPIEEVVEHVIEALTGAAK